MKALRQVLQMWFDKDSFFRNDAVLQDIEYILVETKGKKTEVLIETARYNLSAKINFKIGICPIGGNLESIGECQETVEPRTGSQTVRTRGHLST